MEMDTPLISFMIREGVLICTYKKGIRIDLPLAKEIVRSRLEFSKGVSMPTLILSHGVISMDKGARDFMASVEGTEGLLAAAIIVNSTFSSFLGNFFLKVTTTKMPVRIFSSVNRALGWVQKFNEFSIT